MTTASRSRHREGPPHRSVVADVCTGSGVVGIAAVRLGAARVSAWDISESAVQCARANADAAGVVVDVRRGSLDRALARGPYDIVVSNPPYVPAPKGPLGKSIPDEAGSPWAYNAGEDGRMVLDPLPRGAGSAHTRWDLPSGVLRVLRYRRNVASAADAPTHGADRCIATDSVRPGTHGAGAVVAGHRPDDTGQRCERLVVIRADR